MGFLNWVRVQWDRAAAVVAAVTGLAALLLGWWGVSGESYVSKQIPYIVSGALLGIFLIGAAAVLWLSADLRDEWRELRGIRVLLRDEARTALTAGVGPSQDVIEVSDARANGIAPVGAPTP